MLRIKRLLLACLSLAILPLVSCEKGFDPSNPPIVELDCYELSIEGTGGDIPLFYGVTNAIKGERPTATANVAWITVTEVTNSTIMLKIDESDEPMERLGVVTVNYTGMEKSIKVYITQDKQPLNDFSFSISDITYKSCTVKYTPRNKQRPYMANIIDSEYFKQTGITDGEVFVANEMESYLALAQRNNMTLEELMERVSPQLIYRGDAERKFSSMQPGATYTIYSYGIEFNGNSYTMTTPLHTTIVDIPMPSMYDVSFDIATSISSTMANIQITPSNWSGYYAVQIAPDDSLHYIPEGEQLTEYTINNLASSFYTNARNAMKSGYSAEQFLRSSCYSGTCNVNIQLSTGKKYMVIVFAVESTDGDIPVMRSIPTIKYIK